MKKITCLLIGVSILLFVACCWTRQGRQTETTEKGYCFEKTYNGDIQEMNRLCKGKHFDFMAAVGYTNLVYEEIAIGNVSLDSVYITDMYVVFQVGDSVVTFSHHNWIKEPKIDTVEGQWQECLPINTGTKYITADSAFRIFMNSGVVDTTYGCPVGNCIILRRPDFIDSDRPSYIFGNEENFVVMDADGRFVPDTCFTY